MIKYAILDVETQCEGAKIFSSESVKECCKKIVYELSKTASAGDEKTSLCVSCGNKLDIHYN